MTEFAQLLAANRAFAAGHIEIGSARPSGHLAVVTCMDCRIDVLGAMGLDLGQAHVIRNAGGRVTDDVRRSLALSTHVLGVDMVVIMQHISCGLAGVTNARLCQLTGAAIEFLPIEDHARALQDDIAALAATPYLEPIQAIAGFVFDVHTGTIDELVRWKRPPTKEPNHSVEGEEGSSDSGDHPG